MRRAAFIFICFWPFAASFARVGYFKPSEMPPALTPKIDSVFRIVLLSESPVKEISRAELRTEAGLARGGERKLLEEWLASCVPKKKCASYLRGHGTAFLAGDALTLWTARHNIQDFVSAFQAQHQWPSDSELLSNRDKISLHFLLFDQNEHLVFDTRQPTDRAVLGFFLPRSCPNLLACAETDVVSIQLSHGLGSPPLRFTQGSPQRGETVYAVGYPKETSGRDASSRVPNSDGQNVYVSMGVAIAPPHCDQATALHVDMSNVDRNLLFFDADVVGGNSGGPVFDAQGGVVSMVLGNWCRASASADAYTGSGAVGIRPEWLQSLRADWEKTLRAAISPALATFGIMK